MKDIPFVNLEVTPDLPTHKTSQIADSGILLKVVTPSLTAKPVDYPHLDDYYLFGMVEEGICRVSIDFKEHPCSKGDVIFVQPGQVHRFIDSSNLKAYLLIVDSAFVNDTNKRIFEAYTLSISPFRLTNRQQEELKQLFLILSNRTGLVANEVSKALIQNLVSAIIGIMADSIQENPCMRPVNPRYAELTLRFKKLLDKNIHISRSPSYYAGLMNISPLYLNEAVKNITGLSAKRNIQSEVILRAKRMLVYTSKSVQEIALELGFEDYAYFTRLFTKVTGVNPTSFRKKYLE